MPEFRVEIDVQVIHGQGNVETPGSISGPEWYVHLDVVAGRCAQQLGDLELEPGLTPGPAARAAAPGDT